MSDYDDFQKALSDTVMPIAQKLLQKHKRGIKKTLRNELSQNGRPTRLGVSPSPSEGFIYKIFTEFQEISNSYQSLENIEIYMRRFPYQDTRISPIAYLRYNYENYLHEIYVLYERLEKYLKIVRRYYRNEEQANSVIEVCKLLNELLSKAFQGLVHIRGSHVHAERYEDSEIRLLVLLDMLSRGDAHFKKRYQETYKETRYSKILWIKENKAYVRQFLDLYFKTLRPILFDERANIKIPNALKKNRGLKKVGKQLV